MITHFLLQRIEELSRSYGKWHCSPLKLAELELKCSETSHFGLLQYLRCTDVVTDTFWGGFIQIVESVNDLAQIMKDLSVLVIDQVCLDSISVLLISSIHFISSSVLLSFTYILPNAIFECLVGADTYIQIFVWVILCTGNHS